MRAELERVLASRNFASAERQRRMLRYIVEKTLAGQADQLKEYSVGVDVFDRDASYDPRLDSIVRVEAGRLRSRLDEYYNGDGVTSPIRITLPRGGYVPQFEPRPPAPPAVAAAPATTPRTWPSWSFSAVLVIAVGSMVLWLGGWHLTPAQTNNADAAVLPFSSEAQDQNLAARLTEHVTVELARLGTISVVSHTSAKQFASTTLPLRRIADTLNADFIVEGTVEREPSGVLLVARIVSAETDRKIWVADYRGAADDLRGIAQQMAFDVSAELVKRR